jgi:hypothetical protein
MYGFNDAVSTEDAMTNWKIKGNYECRADNIAERSGSGLFEGVKGLRKTSYNRIPYHVLMVVLTYHHESLNLSVSLW